jgi:hypothetical protein
MIKKIEKALEKLVLDIDRTILHLKDNAKNNTNTVEKYHIVGAYQAYEIVNGRIKNILILIKHYGKTKSNSKSNKALRSKKARGNAKHGQDTKRLHSKK